MNEVQEFIKAQWEKSETERKRKEAEHKKEEKDKRIAWGKSKRDNKLDKRAAFMASYITPIGLYLIPIITVMLTYLFNFIYPDPSALRIIAGRNFMDFFIYHMNKTANWIIFIPFINWFLLIMSIFFGKAPFVELLMYFIVSMIVYLVSVLLLGYLFTGRNIIVFWIQNKKH